MAKTYIGIDPGSSGFITIQRGGVFEFLSIADHDLYEINDTLKSVKEAATEGIMCVIEDVHALVGSSAKSTFSFGYNKGYLVGLLCANRIPYSLINPQVWQKCIWEDKDKVYKSSVNTKTGKVTKRVDTKPTSMNAAKRIFPELDFRKTPKCKNPDDNKVDSILMSEYARRNNL